MIYLQDYIINGSETGKASSLPTFRVKDLDIPSMHDGSFTEEDCISYGKDCGARILPYTMQESYNRDLNELTIKAVVMENDNLKAVFLPTYGAKLMSLYSKTEKRELLFKNSVMRPGNLANRNAWTSGGIEWNLGHRGHCAFTCDNMFCSKVKGDDGEEFIRFYEYEATHAQAYQLDFHLPDGANQLGMLVRVFNARNVDSPLYWWTNTAVPLTDDTRVFSATDDIIYQVTGGFGRCKMPYQPNLPGIDVSYPNRLTRSIEYFFQNDKKNGSPWEVSVEKDGTGFFERSSSVLFARKMFCWGNTSGGNRWCDYLSEDGQGNYLEVQAGLAATQNHSATLPAAGELSFVQLFGAFNSSSKDYALDDWGVAQKGVADDVEKALSADDVQALYKNYYAKSDIAGYEMINDGSIYGQLENERCTLTGDKALPSHLNFNTDNSKQSMTAWSSLLKGTPLPNDVQIQYLTDPKWMGYLESEYKNSDKTKYHYAVSLVENMQLEKGMKLLEELSSNGDSYASYALGLICARDEMPEDALKYYMTAFEQAPTPKDKEYLDTLIPALTNKGDYAKAWEIYESVTEESIGEKARLSLCKVAMELGNLEFAEKELFFDYALIREGALALSDTYFEYYARKKAKAAGVEYSNEMFDNKVDLPRKLDFRMHLL